MHVCISKYVLYHKYIQGINIRWKHMQTILRLKDTPFLLLDLMHLQKVPKTTPQSWKYG